MSDKPSAGVVFDVDGTLLDTNYLHTIAWTRALRAHGHDEVTMQQVHGAIGIASDGLVEHLIGKQDDELASAHADFYEPFKDDIRPFPKAADLMRACHELGLRVVIATSGQKDDLDWMLPAIGIEKDIVDDASTSADVEDAKPSPQLMEAAMDKSDLDPRRTVAIGDTIWDIQAATRAGIPCIALTCGGIGEAELRAEGAAEVWADPADLLDHIDESLLGRFGTGD